MKKRHFIKLYDQYASRIYRFVSLKVNSPQDSEDLTSEAFFKFWQNIKSKKKEGNKEEIINPRALLYRIANNLVIDFYRKKSKKEMILDPTSTVLVSIKDKVDLGEKTRLDSDVEEVKKAIIKLKDDYQNVIVWRYLDELSTKEISEILGKTEGATRVLVHRAMNALKKEF